MRDGKQIVPEIDVHLNDLRHIQAAEGFVELGMYGDAESELEQIGAEHRDIPQVLTLRVCIYAGLEKWDLMQAVASQMARHFPDDAQWRIWWAAAARRAESIEVAKKILLEALETHPNDPQIHYDLSCYESRLHHFHRARRHLARAIQLDSRFQLIALNDRELRPLWKKMVEAEELRDSV